MTDEPKIPFGYKVVQGQSQKGDGIYDPVAGKFRKVRKQYPFCGGSFPVIIRKCEAVQQELPVITVRQVSCTVHPDGGATIERQDGSKEMLTKEQLEGSSITITPRRAGCRIFTFE